jgi:phosphoketolase
MTLNIIPRIEDTRVPVGQIRQQHAEELDAIARYRRVAVRASERIQHYEYTLIAFRRYIQENGVDPAEITNWKWTA